MEAQNPKGQRCPIQEGEPNHPAVKNCIKQLGPNHWLLGPSLICKRDISSNTFSTFFKSKESSLEGSPLDPKGPIQLVRCIQGNATWRIGEWAYFKLKYWTENMGMEFAAIEFVQEKAPTVPVPTILEHYVDETAHLSYTLISSIPGTDLNETWITLDQQQKFDIVNQVAKHIHTLAQLKSEKLQSADKKWNKEPFLSLHQNSSIYRSIEDRILGKLLDPAESQAYEKIWGVEQNKFVFYHADLGPTNIKIMVKDDGKAIVTGLLDWENAGYLPKGWVSTKFYVAGGLSFDWDGEKGENEWPIRLGMALIKMGYPAFVKEWSKWDKDMDARPVHK